MNVLLYIPGQTLAGQKLENKIRSVVPAQNLEIFSDFDPLCRRLHEAIYDLAAAVLLAKSVEDLTALGTLAELLSGIRLILVLPGHDPEIIEAGYRMWPRFVSYTDGDFTDVAKVLEKIWRLTAGAPEAVRVSEPGSGKGRRRLGGSKT